MIAVLELRERAREWSLREDVVEKDYVLGWLLWAIASEPALADTWVFKGGTCLKKCYFETYRFSEDLDFTLIEGAPDEPGTLREIFAGVAERLYEAAGIEIPADRLRFDAYQTPRGARAIQGRVYYRGPRAPGGDLPRIKIDLTADEVLVYEPVRRAVAHPYSDTFPTPAQPLCYCLPEIFGEKLRAMVERCLPRDLYDIFHIFHRADARGTPAMVAQILGEKCRHKAIPPPTFASIQASPRRAELDAEWANMLAHQLPQLPPLAAFVDGLREVFAWLEGYPVTEPVPAPPLEEAGIDATWTPPPTITTWPAAVPLEAIRFAGANRLCVDLGYQDAVRRVEPYALRRSRDGALLLHAVRRDTRESRSYRIDRVTSVRVTAEAFTPAYPVEFWETAALSVPSAARRASPSSPRPASTGPTRRRPAPRAIGPRYVVECLDCHKRFVRRDTDLNRHQMKGQPYECPGRTGFIVRPAR